MRRDFKADPDLELVDALICGKDSAFDELMTRYDEPVFHFVLRHIRNETDARELAQEVFVRLYFNIGKFKPDAKFSTWLYQIALNLCRDYAKSRHTRQSAVTESLSERDDELEGANRELAVENRTPSDEAITRERMAALEVGIEALPFDLRTALVMTAVEQRSHEACAELLGTTAKAVETRVYRARKLLLEWMSKAGFAVLLVGLFR